ncbi:hypothetical protein C0J52_09624 [Blattella germanica]|nr:hypothetical protein C0J52_09624 [Blattella germanica]
MHILSTIELALKAQKLSVLITQLILFYLWRCDSDKATQRPSKSQDIDCVPDTVRSGIRKITQTELKDLVRDLDLSKNT